jgi:hypothetical protein
MHPAKLASGFLFVALLFACHHAGPPSTRMDPSTDQSRQEATLSAALRWIPTREEYRGLPVVLMAGSAHGDFRPAWIDSVQSAKVVHHACTALTVAECPDSARAAYVGFNQPVMADDRSAEVKMTIVVMNPAGCSHGSTAFTEVTGRLHMPWPGSTLSNYQWTQEKSDEARC